MKKTQRIISIILAVITIMMITPIYSITVNAEESFVINCKTYTEYEIKNITYSSCYNFCEHSIGASGHVCCVRKSKEAYKFFWGQECINNYKRDDLLYGHSDIPITVENVKKYLKAADPGAIVYFVRSNDTSYGHAFLLLKVKSDDTGAWILNCNYDGKGNCAVQQKSWDDIVALKNFTNANILYYIQFPNGASYQDRVSNIGQPTGEDMLNKLMQMFPNGKYWNHLAKSGHGYSNGTKHYSNTGCGDVENTFTSTPCANHTSAASVGQYDCNSFNGAIQCAGFARKLAQLAYGESDIKSNWNKTTNKSAALQVIKPGDVLHYFASNTDQKNGHWVFVIGVSGSTITVGECNWGAKRPESNCLISWGRSFDLNTATSLTLYRAPSELGGVSSSQTYTYVSIGSDTYYIKNKSTDTYLTADGTSDPSNVSVKIFSGESTQKFILNGTDKPYVISPSFNTSLSLNPYAAQNGSNVNIHTSQAESENDQHWYFEAVSGGYIIHNANNPAVVLGLNIENVCLKTRTGADDQIWVLESATTINKSYLGVAGIINSENALPLDKYVTFDVYLNGKLEKSSIGTYYEELPVGTKYDIKNIKVADGYSYDGIYSGALSGTVDSEETIVCLALSDFIIDGNSPQIIIDQINMKPGSEANVIIKLKNNPGISSMKLVLTFDEKLILTNIKYNSSLGGMSQQPQTTNSPVILNWFNGVENTNGDLDYAELTFKLSENTVPGTVIPITASYDSNDIFNINEQNIRFAVISGSVTAVSHTPGDINDDGELNNKDVVQLFKYLSGWDIKINLAAADCNGDGERNNKDVVILFKYLSGWNVEIK